MAKEIRISIKSGFDPSGVSSASRAIEKMSADLMKSNKWLMQVNSELSAAIHRNAENIAVDMGAAADKGAAHAILSAKEIEAAWAKAMGKMKPTAKRSFGQLSEVAKGAARGIGGAFGNIANMFLQGGIWGAAAAAVTKAFTFLWGEFKRKSEEAAKRAKEAFEESLKSIERGVSSVAESFATMSAGIDKEISKFDSMTNKVKELTKAEIELAKQQAIANGMDATAATAAANDLVAKVESEAEEKRLKHEIELNQKRVAEAKKAEDEISANIETAGKTKAEAEARYQAQREKYIKKHAINRTFQSTQYGGVWLESADNSEERRAKEGKAFDESEAGRKAREDVAKVEEKIKAAEKEREKIKAEADKATTAIEEANTAISTLETKRKARELSVQNEIAAKVEEEQKKKDEAAKIAAEKEAAAKEAAAKKAAETQARLDREAAAARERQAQKELDQKIRNHQKLLAAEQKAESAAQSRKSAAESKLQQAWGWYRDKGSMAAQLAEEKADAAARKQYVKDFERLKSKRRDWRTAENLSVDDEAVRRVALAQEEKKAAEKHLAEIEKNTAGLSAKLDELMSMK